MDVRAIPFKAKEADEAVAIHGIARTADVGARVGIDACVLDQNRLPRAGTVRTEAIALVEYRVHDFARDYPALELEIEIRSRRRHRDDTRAEVDTGRNVCRELGRLHLHLPSGDKGAQRHVTDFELGRRPEIQVFGQKILVGGENRIRQCFERIHRRITANVSEDFNKKSRS